MAVALPIGQNSIIARRLTFVSLFPLHISASLVIFLAVYLLCFCNCNFFDN
jgi:hypothetical protein